MNRRAFTLLEVVASTLIIAALAVGMFGAFVGSQYIYNRSRHKVQAFNFAREAQDKLRVNFSYLSDPEMTAESAKPESNIGTVIKGEMTNLDTQLTYDVSEPVSDGYKEVVIHVTWDETSF